MLRCDGQTVLVLGLGESGLAMARWIAAGGGAVRVADTRAEPPMRATLAVEMPAADVVLGAFTPALLERVDRVAISPGLSPNEPAVKALLHEARARGIEVVGEIELFARALADLRTERGYAPRIVGITGTNGKTTTTRLTARMIAACGRTVVAAGNVSPTALDSLRERLAADDLPQVWVLELSSFQLESTQSLACDAAAILNLTPDHLDWHGDLAAYGQAKARILAQAPIHVFARSDAQVMALASGAPVAAADRPLSATTLGAARVGRRRRGTVPSTARVVTFGIDVPTRPGEFGLDHDGALVWLACAEESTNAPRQRGRVHASSGSVAAEVFVQRLMPVDALPIPGRHNALNVLAALALGRALGCPLAPMLHALRDFRGEPHRLELVATIDAVAYYDDSKGTNVGATVAAVESLGAMLGTGRLLAILGGEGKGQDFSALRAPLLAHARAVALIGRDAPAIAAVLAGTQLPIGVAASLPEAVDWCAGQAHAGDAVLLSPACASFDMFRNYGHRGEVFAQTVQARQGAGMARSAPC